MKKLISILTTLTMLFTFAAIPAFAEGETVDFTAAENIAYGKKVYGVKGAYYTGSGAGNPGTAGNTAATDGDFGTFHSGNNTAEPKHLIFTIDLEAVYSISEIALYIGSNQSGRAFNIYVGTEKDFSTHTLYKSEVSPVAATVNETEVAEGKVSKNREEVLAQYISFEYTGGGGFTYSEIYVKGEAIETPGTIVNLWAEDNLAYDKTVTDLPYGRYYDSNWPVLLKQNNITDGSIYTRHSATGTPKADSGREKGLRWTLDLGAEYDLSEITFYGTVAKNFNLRAGTGSDFDSQEVVATLKSTDAVASTINGVENVYVFTAGFTENVRARYVSLDYTGTSDFGYHEISVKGSPIQVDFSQNNLVYNEECTLLYGTDADFGTGANLVDGDINTGCEIRSAQPNGAVVLVDLKANYSLSNLTLYQYALNRGMEVYVGHTAEALELVGTMSSGAGVSKNINGRVVSEHSFDLTDCIGRYVAFKYPTSGNYSFCVAEISVKGEEVTTLTDATKTYSYDATTGVTASVKLFNGSETPSTAGKVFFAAYAGDVLVGTAIADAASLETGASATIAPEAFAVTAEPTTVKAYYWTDKLVPIFDSAIDLK